MCAGGEYRGVRHDRAFQRPFASAFAFNPRASPQSCRAEDPEQATFQRVYDLANRGLRGTIPSGSPLDKRREPHHRMAFGNYKIKADFGGERITDRNSATAFMLALTAIYRNKPHWKLADQALRQASKSAAAESRASAAFKAAIEAEGWLEN
jgi:hypothetical protein